MGDKIVIRTVQVAFEDLHARAEKARGTAVGVSRAALLALLMDHSLMVGKLEDAGYEVVDGMGEGTVPVRVRRRGE